MCCAPLFASNAIAQSPTSIFAPAATPAHSIFDLSMLVLSVTLAIFLIVAGLLLYALIRYRHRPEDAHREPAQESSSELRPSPSRTMP
jgi:cytochrome c oxidase subunit 2